jgi:hypothetical protein
MFWGAAKAWSRANCTFNRNDPLRRAPYQKYAPISVPVFVAGNVRSLIGHAVLIWPARLILRGFFMAWHDLRNSGLPKNCGTRFFEFNSVKTAFSTAIVKNA